MTDLPSSTAALCDDDPHAATRTAMSRVEIVRAGRRDLIRAMLPRTGAVNNSSVLARLLLGTIAAVVDSPAVRLP